MIPLAAIPWRLIGYGVAVAAVLALGWRVHAWREAYKALPEVEAQLSAEVACEDGSQCASRQAALQAAAEAKSAEVVNGYEAELAALRARPVRVRTVRLCADPGDVQGAGATGAADGAGPGAGELHGAAGPDIGPDLYGLAREADEVAARLRALQEWNRALAGE